MVVRRHIEVIEEHVETITIDGVKSKRTVPDEPGLGLVRIDQLTARQIQVHDAALERAGRSPRMRQLVHVVLHHALRDAVRLEEITRNPCAYLDAPREARRPMHVWTA